jgi:antirestriction protein ArdC
MSDKANIYETITAKIIAAIEADPGTFKMPWHRSAGEPLHMPSNVVSKKHYRGVNVVMLWITAEMSAYRQPIWGTFRQWAQRNCQVRKGEKGTPIIFFKEYAADPDPTDADDTGKRIVARASHVFNCAQVNGWSSTDDAPNLGPVERSERFDAFVRATGAIIHHGGDRAFYNRKTDEITMPDEGRFCGTDTMDRHESYIATLAHELSHLSGSEKRLNRDFGKRFGDQAHAAEEIVAELAACFICAELGISTEPRPDHAQYIMQYLRLLKSDPKAIVTAAAKAAQAADYLKSFSAQVADAA